MDNQHANNNAGECLVRLAQCCLLDRQSHRLADHWLCCPELERASLSPHTVASTWASAPPRVPLA